MECTARGTRSDRVLALEQTWPLFVGIGIGLLFLLASQLDLKWFIFLFAGAMLAGIAFLPIDRKYFFLTLLALTIPLAVDLNLMYQESPVRRSTYGIAIHLTHLPLIALFMIWGLRAVMGRIPVRLSMSGLLPLAGLIGAASISVLLSGDRLFGAFDLVALSSSLLLFLYVASEVREIRDIRLVVIVLIASMVVQGIIAVGQHLTHSALGLEFFGAFERSGQKWGGHQGVAALTRVGGTFGHPNQLALFFDLLIPLGLSLIFIPRRAVVKCLLLTAVGMGLAGLAVTLSRGGLIAVGIGTVVILLLRWATPLGMVRSALALSLIGSLLLAMLLLIPNPVQRRFMRDDYKETMARRPLVTVAVKMIRDRPLFGVGLNGFTQAAKRYDTTLERITSSWNAPVHNLWLFIAGEIGLTGLGCLLMLLFFAMRDLPSAIRSHDPFLSAVGLGLLVGLTAFLLHLQNDYTPWTRSGIFWTMLGLAVSAGRLGKLTAATSR